MPFRLPIQWRSRMPRACRAAATARPAFVWPPVPPPAMTTRARSPGAAMGLPVFEREVDQPRDQLRVGQPRGLPEPRVSRGGGESRNRIDLVDEDAIRALDEEVHPGHTGAVDGHEGPDGERPDPLCGLRRQRGRDLESSPALAVL